MKAFKCVGQKKIVIESSANSLTVFSVTQENRNSSPDETQENNFWFEFGILQ